MIIRLLSAFRVLFRQLLVHKLDTERSIFYADGEPGASLKLRPSISFHFFLNYALCTNESGQFRLHTKPVRDPQRFAKRPRIPYTQSTVDKVLKWNVVGYQGYIYIFSYI